MFRQKPDHPSKGGSELLDGDDELDPRGSQVHGERCPPPIEIVAIVPCQRPERPLDGAPGCVVELRDRQLCQRGDIVDGLCHHVTPAVAARPQCCADDDGDRVDVEKKEVQGAGVGQCQLLAEEDWRGAPLVTAGDSPPARVGVPARSQTKMESSRSCRTVAHGAVGFS